ncbi:GspH/FimT family protein [Piscirickettsia litoralis]|uniref:Type II secretion system protein H n=1 Tax=Piscirickettsia litoralis TaxID=1891921 RepID=A0ABX3A3Q9_9GAMM|nr:GspH/FimT family pseudopilin [Piscirickettsia litoralis]ODN43486.1 prepilin-type N-terminal cleavage/methylation domain-containing protein [Piscirickettsia litoralis]
MLADYTRDSQSTPNSSTKGFSLTEVLVILALLSLLITLTLPNLSGLKERENHQYIASQLEKIIKLGREHALYQQATVTLCPTTNQILCHSNWQQPLMLFLDKNQDNQRNINETLIATLNPTPLNLTWNRGNHLSFYGENGLAASNGTLTLCSAKLNQQFILNRQGRLRKTDQPCTLMR